MNSVVNRPAVAPADLVGLPPAAFWPPAQIGPPAAMPHLPLIFAVLQLARPALVVQLGGPEEVYRATCEAAARLGCGTKVLRFESAAEALRHVADGTVDLLHLDGRAAGFEAGLARQWLARLSRHALLLVTGAAELSGVWRGAIGAHRAFHMPQHGGAVLVAIGPAPPVAADHFMAAVADPSCALAAGDAFARLGTGLSDAAMAVRARTLQHQIETQRTASQRAATQAAADVQRAREAAREAARIGAEALRQAESRNAQLAAELHAIHHSTSWRLLEPFRRLFQRTPRAARLLRRGARLGWWAVTLQLPRRIAAWRELQAATPLAIPAAAPPAPAPAPAAETVEPGRVAALEHWMQTLGPTLHAERNRLDLALAGVEGVLDEIGPFHAARATADYQLVFDAPEPLVSVCVATVNRPDLLIDRCLRSLREQSYRNLQIVVVGDHCTDDTGHRIAQLRDDRIVFHNLAVRGPYPPPGFHRWQVAGSNAMNHALPLCEGGFITHLDDDDVAVHDRIETLVAAAQAGRADFCWHALWSERPNGTWTTIGNGRIQLGEISTGAIFYHRYLARIPWDVQAFRLEEPGDWNRLRKIRALRPRTHYIERPLVYHYTQNSQPKFVQQDGETFLE